MVLLMSEEPLVITDKKKVHDFSNYIVTEIRNHENKVVNLFAQTKSTDVPMIYTVINNDEVILDFEIDFETFDFIFENSNVDLEQSKQEAIAIVNFMRNLFIN